MKNIFCYMCICFLIPAMSVSPLYAQSIQMSQDSDNLDAYEDVSEMASPSRPLVHSSKITLELKGVDILDVLKVLSKKSGLNIVAGKNVRGQVTLFLQDVDVWDALKIVLETSELAYEKKGDIIKVITEADYEARYGRPYEDKTITEIIQLEKAKVQVASEMLNQIKSTVGRIIVDESTNSMIIIDTPEALRSMKKAVRSIDVSLKTRIFELRYAKADDIEAKLSEMITPNVGMLKVDSRTNKVFIADIPSKVTQIENMIRVFDEKPLQVLIDAKIIEVVLEDEYALGIDWDLVFSYTKNRQLSYGNNSLGGVDIPSSGGPLAGLDSGDLAVFTINSSDNDFSAVISAIEGMGKTNTLSNPRVAVLNNEEASIAVATRQPFVSQTVVQGDSTSTTADNVEFVDVGVTLSVVPSITLDDYILMAVKPAVSNAGTPLTLSSTDAQGQQFTRTVIPVVTSQEVETKVLVKSGTTIVLGGLIQDSQSVKQKKVPLLGDIPWIGAAFRNKSDDFKKTELVIFITPSILPSDQSTREIARYLDDDNSVLPFNDFGGRDNEYYDASNTSQSYFHSDDNSFWEESKLHQEELELKREKKNEGTFVLDREHELQKALAAVSVSSAPSTRRVQASDPGVRSPRGSLAVSSSAGTASVVSSGDAYSLKQSMFDAIVNEPLLKGLSGEVTIDFSITKDGYLKRLRARSLEDPALNSFLILAINNNAPYPLPQDGSEDEEQRLSYSFFF
jgi:type II secretory pathway component GspD/PulD (secretin)